MFTSVRIFYRNVFKHIQTTGSIAPSSRFLAAAITQCVKPEGDPITILEAGPGTGPFTRVLAQKLRQEDRLDLCELNNDFAHFLQQQFETDPVLRARKDRITLYHQAVQDLEGENRYDYIVSGLPFNNFHPDLVSEILQCYQTLLKPGGILSFFEYAWVRHMKRPFVNQNERDRINQVEAALQRHFDKNKTKEIFVALNIPPSIVHVCQYP